ncbi:hypothetical protein ACWEVD_25010 [Nocardia thailandica]
MTYLVALIAITAIAVLCWKAFGPRPGGPSAPPTGRKPILGPDDDPDFLWRLSHERRDGPSGPNRPDGS